MKMSAPEHSDPLEIGGGATRPRHPRLDSRLRENKGRTPSFGPSPSEDPESTDKALDSRLCGNDRRTPSFRAEWSENPESRPEP